MLFTALFALAGTALLALFNLLPTVGCGLISWSTIHLGWIGYYFDATAWTTVLVAMVAVEVAMKAFRVALFVLKNLPVKL